MKARLLPTLPGKAPGVVGLDPLVLQCQECGATHTQDGRGVAMTVILSGFHFHTCHGDGLRRCPDCLARVIAACPSRRCKQ